MELFKKKIGPIFLKENSDGEKVLVTKDEQIYAINYYLGTISITILSPVDELYMSIDISNGMTWEDLDNKLGSNYLTSVNGSNCELVIDDNGVGLGSVQGNTPDDMYSPYCFYIRTLNDDGTSTLVKPTDTISSDLSYKIFTSLTGE